MAFDDGFSTRKRASKLCLALVSTRSSSAFFCPRCGVRISTLRRAALLRQQLLQRLAVLEIHRHVNLRRDVLLVQINLLQQRGEELRLVEFLLVFPEEFAPVDNLAVAQVEEVQRHQRRLGVAAEDVDVVALGRRHLLPLVRSLPPWPAGRAATAASSKRISPDAASMRARSSRARSLCRPSRNSRTSRTACGVRLVRGQALHARPQAAVNVVLQARLAGGSASDRPCRTAPGNGGG